MTVIWVQVDHHEMHLAFRLLEEPLRHRGSHFWTPLLARYASAQDVGTDSASMEYTSLYL